MTQAALFAPKSDWTPTPVHELPRWPEKGRIGLDVETCDPNLETLGPGDLRDGRLVGVSFAIEDGPTHYLPFGHKGEGNLDPEKVFAYLDDNLPRFRGTIVGANLSYDLGYLAAWGDAGIVPNATWYRDVLAADVVINELHQNYSLAAVAARHGLPGKDESLLLEAARMAGVNPKKGLWQLSASCVGPYAERDAALPLQLLRRQERIIEEEDLQQVWDLESRVLPVLVKMRQRGVRVDVDRLEQFEAWALEQETASLAEATTKSGVKLASGDLWTAVALAPALESIGVKVPKTPKTGAPSIKDDFMEGLDHPVAEAIRRARRMNKARTTFATQVRTHLARGRIHAEFHQLRRTKDDGSAAGGRFGRLSCSGPNLQQQPNRDQEIGPRWRSIYLPEDGERWASCDLSQQEPRWMIHYAEKAECPGGAAAAQRYRDDPNLDSHDAMARLIHPGWDDLPKDERKLIRDRAKIIALGVPYNMGEAKLCRDLGLPTARKKNRFGVERDAAGPEGKKILEEFHDRVPFLRRLVNMCRAAAKERGYLRTEFGRVMRFPMKPGGEYDWVSLALNRLIQGTSADQMKHALVNAVDAGLPVNLQVHDELDMSFGDEDQVRQLAHVMRTAVPCRVPHRVEAKVGPSWGELPKWKMD